jgi:tyrosyl-tRNA synthetase
MPAAAGHQPGPDRCRKPVLRLRHGGGGHRRQRRRSVLDRQAVRLRPGEIVTVERFRRRPGKEGIHQESRHKRLVGPSGTGEGAVEIRRQSAMPPCPVIDRGIAGAGIEGKNVIFRLADPGDIGNAADIQHRDRPFQIRGKGGVEQRHERGAFAARGHIGAAKILDHIDAGERGEQAAIANLPGSALLRPVQDRMAVKADEIGIEPMAADEQGGGIGMGPGELLLDFCDWTLATENGADPLAQSILIGQGEGRSGDDMPQTIALDIGCVDSVQRCAAHQTDGLSYLCHAEPFPCRDPFQPGSQPNCGVRAVHATGPALSSASCLKSFGSVMTSTAQPVFRSSFLEAAAARGFLHQCTDPEGLDAKHQEGPVTAYIGFDCTADSLHAGSLLQIMTLRLFQRCGHKPIVLMGGGTTKIGDPSGKDEARRLIGEEEIAQNMAGIGKVFAKFLKFGDGPSDAVMVNNADWLDHLHYVSFLRDVGRHFSVNRMLTMDSVKLRLEREQPLSFLEFNYMVLQAYDFLELARRHGCVLQMGGSDQWGNIVSGVELGRRIDNRALFGLTTPLLATASGAKMGKTAQGAVWLNEERLPVYDYWQYWRNADDADVGRFLKLFTDLPLDEIARLEALGGSEINEAKKILATEVTALAHGREAAEAAAETARQVFEQGGIGGDLPVVEVPEAELHSGRPLIQYLQLSGLASSLGDARRLIRGGGAKVNDASVSDENLVLTLADLDANGVVKLSAGKKRHALVKPIGG